MSVKKSDLSVPGDAMHPEDAFRCTSPHSAKLRNVSDDAFLFDISVYNLPYTELILTYQTVVEVYTF